MHATWSVHLTPSVWDHPNNIWLRVWIINITVFSSLLLLYLLGSKQYPQHPVVKHPLSVFFRQCEKPSSTVLFISSSVHRTNYFTWDVNSRLVLVNWARSKSSTVLLRTCSAWEQERRNYCGVALSWVIILSGRDETELTNALQGYSSPIKTRREYRAKSRQR
jgi:hypothetical protein